MTERINAKWTPARIARLGFLVGLGWDAPKVAVELVTTPSNIYRQAWRVGLSFREATSEWRAEEVLLLAAERRGITPRELIDRVITELKTDPVLIDNILDDDQ